MLFSLFLLFFLSLFLYPFYVVYRQTLGEHEPIVKRPDEWGAEYDDIEYVTSDGVTLKGWWVPGRSKRAVLLLHGKSGSRNGFHSGVFELGRWYHGRGYQVMMVDMRAHGESGGKYIYFGIREHADMLGWIQDLDPARRYRWSLHGFSMGAVTALMMADRSPGRFAKVVADAPWIDFERVVKQELWKRARIPYFAYPYIEWIAKTFFGQSFKLADNFDRCRRLCGKEILYIVEKDDHLLAPYHWTLLKKACLGAHIVFFEDVGHVQAFKEMPDRYTALLEKEGL